MIWSKEETLSREQLNALQQERLQETVKRVYDKVLPYRKKMDDIGLKPEDIKSLSDLSKLPFITKQDMRDTYPFGLFAVEKENLVRIHASSGTTGKPTVVGYTQNDLKVFVPRNIINICNIIKRNFISVFIRLRCAGVVVFILYKRIIFPINSKPS